MNEFDVCQLYERTLAEAKQRLRDLAVFCGKDPAFSGLSGWIFEQTVQKCIRDSLAEAGVNLPIEEQVSLGGRSKADLSVGATAIELKTAGLFGINDIQKYAECQSKARVLGMHFVFLSRSESYAPYRVGIGDALGAENVFFLDEPGSWERFITTLSVDPAAAGA